MLNQWARYFVCPLGVQRIQKRRGRDRHLIISGEKGFVLLWIEQAFRIGCAHHSPSNAKKSWLNPIGTVYKPFWVASKSQKDLRRTLHCRGVAVAAAFAAAIVITSSRLIDAELSPTRTLFASSFNATSPPSSFRFVAGCLWGGAQGRTSALCGLCFCQRSHTNEA